MNEHGAGDHYFSARPSSPSGRREVRFRVDGRAFALASDRGVFSADRLDPGTAVLLREVREVAGSTVLDLGCGYGPLTCVLALRRPDATVWAVDVNTRALDLTTQNVARIGASGRVHVCAPDQVPDEQVFDEIWCNPPIRIGKRALHALLRHWLARLRPDGQAWLVVAKNLGADSLQRWLQSEGWEVRRHASSAGFRVLRVQPRAP